MSRELERALVRLGTKVEPGTTTLDQRRSLAVHTGFGGGPPPRGREVVAHKITAPLPERRWPERFGHLWRRDEPSDAAPGDHTEPTSTVAPAELSDDPFGDRAWLEIRRTLRGGGR